MIKATKKNETQIETTAVMIHEIKVRIQLGQFAKSISSPVSMRELSAWEPKERIKMLRTSGQAT